MSKELPHLKFLWNYLATSHGKGPNDALGGNVKAMALRRILTRQNLVKDALSFIEAVEDSRTTIKMMHVSKKEIKVQCDKLNLPNIWQGLSAVTGTFNTHYVSPTANGIVRKLYTDANELITCPINVSVEVRPPMPNIIGCIASHSSDIPSTSQSSRTCSRKGKAKQSKAKLQCR